jgi:hypothetical protein
MPTNVTVNIERVVVEMPWAQLDRIETALAKLNKLTSEGLSMASKELDAIAAEVERNTTIDGSVALLLTRLSEQIATLKNDPAKLQALADSMRASNDRLAAALAANTPADDGGSVAPVGTTPVTPTPTPPTPAPADTPKPEPTNTGIVPPTGDVNAAPGGATPAPASGTEVGATSTTGVADAALTAARPATAVTGAKPAPAGPTPSKK